MYRLSIVNAVLSVALITEIQPYGRSGYRCDAFEIWTRALVLQC